MNDRKRIDWVDYAKGVGIILMVFGHSGFPLQIQKFIWSFHMPLFFFLSGMMYNSLKYRSINDLVKRIVKTLIIPYIFFSTIVVLGYVLLNYFQGFFITKNWGGIELITNGWGGIALWFVSTLIFVQLLFWFIDRIKGNKFINKSCIIVGTILAAFLSFYCSIEEITFPYKLENVGLSLIFYSSGYLLKGYFFQGFHLNIFLSLSMLLSTFIISQFFERFDICSNNFASGIPSILLALLGITSIVSLSKWLEYSSIRCLGLEYIKCVLKWAGSNTYLIMGISQIVMILLIFLFTNIPISNLLNSVMRIVILWLFLFFSSQFFNKYFPFLVGKKK